MKNNNFRTRLKNHKLEFNPDAWEQMSEILYSIPDSKGDKDKKLYVILLFLLFLVIGLGIYFLNNRIIHPTTSKTTITENSPKTANWISLNNNENISTDLNTKTSISEVKVDKTKKQEEQFKKNVKEKDFSKSSNTLILQDNNKEKYTYIKNDKSKNIRQISINSSLNKAQKSDAFDIKKYQNRIEPGKIKIIDQRNNFGINKSQRKIIFDKLSIRRNLHSSLWDLKYNKPQKANSTNYAAKLNKFFLTGKIGYAYFNSNPGIHIGGGITYRVNKLLFLESELGYSYGEDRNRTFNGVFEKGYQYDLNILAILNLITLKNINFSFELGAGFTIYREQRVLLYKIDYRNHSGLNLQGGLSMTYFLNGKYGVGLKWGIIRYDEAVSYLALKTLKRF